MLKQAAVALGLCFVGVMTAAAAAPAVEAKAEREAAGKAEQAGDWDAALLHYETVYDSTPTTPEERVELRRINSEHASVQPCDLLLGVLVLLLRRHLLHQELAGHHDHRQDVDREGLRLRKVAHPQPARAAHFHRIGEYAVEREEERNPKKHRHIAKETIIAAIIIVAIILVFVFIFVLTH